MQAATSPETVRTKGFATWPSTHAARSLSVTCSALPLKDRNVLEAAEHLLQRGDDLALTDVGTGALE